MTGDKQKIIRASGMRECINPPPKSSLEISDPAEEDGDAEVTQC